MPIFETIFPVLAIACVGYVCAVTELFSPSACDAIAELVFKLLMPVLLFVGTVQSDIPADMDWSFMLAYYLPVLVVYAVGVLCSAWWFGLDAKGQSAFAMGGAYSNTTIVGVPVTLFALGKEALLPLFILVSVHNLVLFSVGMLVAERAQLRGSQLVRSVLDMLKQFVLNPITSSLILGLLVNQFGIELYAPLERGLELLSQACVPVSLFVLGALLNKYHIRGNVRSAVCMVLLRMVAMPLMVAWLAFGVFQLDTLWAATAVLVASMPVGITSYIYAEQLKSCEAPVATAIVLSTIASIVTLPVVLVYIQHAMA